MCSRITSSGGIMSPFAVNLVKVTVVLVFFCFAECAAGSCLNYGHACWGAHGKRSGNQNPLRSEEESGKDLQTQWFLSRLIQGPPDLRFSHERELDIPYRQSSDSLFSGNDVDNLSGLDLGNIQDLYGDDPLFDDSTGRKPMNNNRLRSAKLLDKRSTSHN